jgi:hypothetical protein
MTEWIKVSDRLPQQEDGNYLVCLINNTPCIGSIIKSGFIFILKNNIGFSLNDMTWMNDPLYGNVTHWMPLPKPPEKND